MPSFVLRELADKVNGQLAGDGDIAITGVSDLRSAQPGAISFLGNPRYAPAAKATRASAILVDFQAGSDFPCALIRVESPSLAFSTIADLFAPPVPEWKPGVHPTAVIGQGVVLAGDVSIQPHAVIENGVSIGTGTVVGAGSYIGQGAVIGGNCLLYPRVTVREHSKIGNRVIIHSGAVIGSDGFGYEMREGRHVKIPQIGIVQIDDDVEIGANTTIDRARFGCTWIQRGTKIDNLVQIAHNVVIGEHSIVVAQTGISGSTTLGKYVTLAGQVGVVGHIHIGDQATVTAQSGVSKDIPPKTVMAGHHARPLRESLKIEALTQRLPELYERVGNLENKG